MNIQQVIRDLYFEKEKLERAIAALEELQQGFHQQEPNAKRRGRKSMSPQERKEVSERMKRHWASQHALQQ
jgi:hypothetical protein